ncbi:glycosyltransferase family 9 protein [Eikenella sp. S3360]|uniref:Glycosyltransferase family 9 protein n=1 Tax=Eikenella glucosivorans TaxID=2766967 RepID=A0ABS0N8F4_9NEIS|nr:glycosyltransferase family 9 protein [Eikenella glucosivorans]MBH5328582.1 glycosyltransferase family 9 protein [Eikenella glucosivorans]
MSVPLSKRLILALCAHKTPCRHFDFGNISSILIRPFGQGLGDAMMHLAFAEQIKSAIPHIRLGVIVGRNRDIFARSQYFDELIPATLKGYYHNRKKWQFLLDFSESFNTPDLIADKILLPQAVMIFSKADKAYYNHQSISNFDFCCPFIPTNHVVRHLETSLLAKYFTLSHIPPSFSVSKEEIYQANTFWPKQPTIKILLAPQGHSRTGKQIPPIELAHILNNAIRDTTRINLLLGNTTNSNEYLIELKKYCRPELNIALSPPTSLSKYLALAASADIIIGVDSGTVHLACALKKPTMAFYGQANIQTWHPLPHPDTPYLLLIASKQNIDPAVLEHFDLAAATNWLREQISNINENLTTTPRLPENKTE